MPVYNAERYVVKCIESILKQTFQDFEFLIMNDGSTDGTGKILEKFAQKDSRIRIFHQENKGIVESLNHLIILADSELIARMDADDIAYPRRLEIQYHYLQKHPDTVLVATRCLFSFKEEKNSFFNTSFFEDFMNRWFLSQNSAFAHSAVMMRKETVIRCGKYNKEWYPAEDYDLWIRLKRWGHINNINEVLMEIITKIAGISSRNFSRQVDVKDELNNRNFEDIYANHEIPTVHHIKEYFIKYGFQDNVKKNISKLACATGCFYIQKNEKDKALPFFLYSLELDPRRIDSLANLLLMLIGRAMLISLDANNVINKIRGKIHWYKKDHHYATKFL